MTHKITDAERLALVLKGYSRRVDQYLQVREIKGKTLAEIRAETGLSIEFISDCRYIAGGKKK